jgi:peptide/nickel transport system substrate-binding protein
MTANERSQRPRERYTRRRLLRSSALLMAGATPSALVACAGPRRPNGGSAGTASSSASAETPQPGGTLAFALDSNPPTLDPHATSSSYTNNVLILAMSRLFQYNAGPDKATAESYQLEPDLALSAESPDGITWTVKLRSDARFHDLPPVNGHAVQAEDVKSTFARALAPNSVNRATFDVLDPNQIEAPSPDTVVFKLQYPYASFSDLVAHQYAYILPREALGGGYDLTTRVIGSGPFILESFAPDVGAVGKKNPDWFQRGRPYLDSVHLPVVTDAQQQLAQFTAGNLHALEFTVANRDFDAAQASNPKAQTYQEMGISSSYVFSQLRNPASPFRDIRVRQAISLALDRESIANTVLGPKHYFSPVLGALWGKYALTTAELPASTAQYFKYDLPQAKKPLSEALRTWRSPSMRLSQAR